MKYKINGKPDLSEYPEIEILAERKCSVTVRLHDISVDDVRDIPGVESVLPDETLSPESYSVESHLQHIKVGEFWSEFGNRGELSRICVADLGCDPAHPDIHLDKWVEFDSNGNELNTSPGFDPTESLHGQRMSSGAVGKNNYDGEYIGVAPECQFYHAKVGATGTSFSALGAAIEWATENDCHAISLSFGVDSYRNWLVPEMRDAWNSGTIPVGSAGNSSDLTTPGAEYHCICTGRVDSDGESITPSATGHGTVNSDMWQDSWPDDWPESYQQPDVCAIGQSVIAASGPSSGWSGSTGTSITAPQVAGVIGLLQTAHYQTKGTFADSDTIRDVLKNEAIIP